MSFESGSEARNCPYQLTRLPKARAFEKPSHVWLAQLSAKALLNRFPKLQLDKASDCRGLCDNARVVCKNQHCLTCTET